MRTKYWLCASVFLTSLALAASASAQKHYSPGVSDTEIILGQTMPYSGPASSYGTIGRAEAAYFAMINDHGGVNGRKIKLISLDDGYSPPKTVEQTRRLVEQEHVLLDYSPLGTPTNSSIQKYLNEQKVPQLLVATGATKWGDPEHFHWTMGWQPTYQTEGHIYAKYLLETKPNAKIGILYQNDDYGKDYVKGLKDGLGAKAATMIVKEVTYETTDPTIDSQIVSLQGSGADVFYYVTIPKFAAQAIRKAHDIGWKPLQLLNSVSNSVGSVLTPAGLEASKDILTVEYAKDPTDPSWKDDPAMKDWLAWMSKYFPDGDKNDLFNVYGYNQAATMVQILKQCGDDLTRENVMKQAANLKNFSPPLLLPGIRINTSPTDYFPIKQEQLARFDGKTWVLFGNVLAMSN
ncbi:MAG TPA: ABC transporter substrate-binding protein [Stellaceae bacterium]|nr:ABC transporter substrate-binding protein [Stellaceae bacterium]